MRFDRGPKTEHRWHVQLSEPYRGWEQAWWIEGIELSRFISKRSGVSDRALEQRILDAGGTVVTESLDDKNVKGFFAANDGISGVAAYYRAYSSP